jgi:hypothetical protein
MIIHTARPVLVATSDPIMAVKTTPKGTAAPMVVAAAKMTGAVSGIVPSSVSTAAVPATVRGCGVSAEGGPGCHREGQ